MNCENCFCAYWKQDQSSLEEISLNITDSCEDCIYIEIDKEILRKEREKMLDARTQRVLFVHIHPS